MREITARLDLVYNPENSKGEWRLTRQVELEKVPISSKDLTDGEFIALDAADTNNLQLMRGDIFQAGEYRLIVQWFEPYSYSYACLLETRFARWYSFRAEAGRRWRILKSRIILTFWVWGLAIRPDRTFEDLEWTL